MNEEEDEEDLEVIAAEENINFSERNMNDDHEMMEDDSNMGNDNDNDQSGKKIDSNQRQKDLEKRLEKELNLRMGNIAFAYEDEEDGLNEDEESKH